MMAICPFCKEGLDALWTYLKSRELYCVSLDASDELNLEQVAGATTRWYVEDFYCYACGVKLPIETEDGARKFLERGK